MTEWGPFTIYRLQWPELRLIEAIDSLTILDANDSLAPGQNPPMRINDVLADAVGVQGAWHFTYVDPATGTETTVAGLRIDFALGNDLPIYLLVRTYPTDLGLQVGDSFLSRTSPTPQFEPVSYAALSGAPGGDDPVPCFVAGTRIATPAGPVPVERLRPGSLVDTLDHGAQPVAWIGRRHLDAATLAAHPELAPIRIAAGALGGGLPRRPLSLSPQHRVLIRSDACALLFGAAEMLVPAKALIGRPGIAVASPRGGVTYCHILFARHEVVLAEGQPAESLLHGPELARTAGPAAEAELRALFPDMARAGWMRPARPVLRRFEARVLDALEPA